MEGLRQDLHPGTRTRSAPKIPRGTGRARIASSLLPRAFADASLPPSLLSHLSLPVPQSEGKSIEDKDHTKDAVNTFYNLVTDIYEWGWGQSFHFSPSLKGKGVAEAEVAHETRVADVLGLAPGLKALDVGCGVGGPMRTIAAHSGAHVTGVTINDYQVKRCTRYCEKLGIDNVEIQQGNVLNLVPQFEKER